MTEEDMQTVIEELPRSHPAVVAAWLLVEMDDAAVAAAVWDAANEIGALMNDDGTFARALAMRLAETAGLYADDADIECQLAEADFVRWEGIFAE
jgi:hypothetical protein